MSKTDLQKLHAEVNCIGYDKSYNVLRYTFSSICFKDNSVSLPLHSHFFLNVYRGRVAAWRQVCRRQICKNFMQKLTALAVIRPTSCCIPLFRQFASRTTQFPFYYILTSFSMFIAVVSLPQCVGFQFFANVAQGQLCFFSNTPLFLSQYLSRWCRCLVPGISIYCLPGAMYVEYNCTVTSFRS